MTETAFFEAIGERFDHLDCRHAVINADVLDAWFPHLLAGVMMSATPMLVRSSAAAA